MAEKIFLLAVILLPFIGSGQATSGTYTPLTTDHSPTINPIAQPAHYFRIDNEVFVYGSVFANGNPTVPHLTFFSVSLPIPSTLNGITTYGQCTVLSALPSVSGGVHVQSGEVQVFWIPNKSLPGQVYFDFVYTVQ